MKSNAIGDELATSNGVNFDRNECWVVAIFEDSVADVGEPLWSIDIVSRCLTICSTSSRDVEDEVEAIRGTEVIEGSERRGDVSIRLLDIGTVLRRWTGLVVETG